MVKGAASLPEAGFVPACPQDARTVGTKRGVVNALNKRFAKTVRYHRTVIQSCAPKEDGDLVPFTIACRRGHRRLGFDRSLKTRLRAVAKGSRLNPLSRAQGGRFVSGSCARAHQGGTRAGEAETIGERIFFKRGARSGMGCPTD